MTLPFVAEAVSRAAPSVVVAGMRAARLAARLVGFAWLSRGHAATKDHRGSMCLRCRSGGRADGGTSVVPNVGCVHWCSRAGFCGDGDQYRGGLDCRNRGDLPRDVLESAAKRAQRESSERYHPEFVREFGRHTFEQYKRGADHGHRFGAAISIRGERHCGTGWVRVMTNDNCRERHYWSTKLDSDGLYGWKHDFLPETLSADSKDAVVVVYRNAVNWVLKMKKTAYSVAIDRIGGSLERFVSAPFVERGKQFAHLLDLRKRKYGQYLAFGRSHANVLGVKYEDLTREPVYLFRKLSALGFDCSHDPNDPDSPFQYVKGYAKFGGTGGGDAHFKAPKNATWSPRDWKALVSRVDQTVERALGYAYDAGRPGIHATYPAVPDSGVLRPEDVRRRRRRRRALR